ncbi:hypothetical protein MiYa_04635 [Microcystis aeruginosa NIES-2519]|uniref:DUF29 domain-containing protein n=1 Tax=Microcystis aeruginosa NIES-2519 TaxID=2303981 RepID=A0A5A5RL32_MICAE|nr:DUF29 domain-containing protein [Microcystis aeruginosa]GCA73076.1 hypothetical protein MiYa_04635 [Microcystis aeruginosa NIES-2519]GCA86539.1 hypothetical protein MiHa_04533 [Microcystis aeruginosa NIES-2522]
MAFWGCHVLKCKVLLRDSTFLHCKGEIRTFRLDILDELKDSPSLKPYLLEIFDECYLSARKNASDRSQLPLDTFPAIPLGSLEQILDEDWFPVGDNLD